MALSKDIPKEQKFLPSFKMSHGGRRLGIFLDSMIDEIKAKDSLDLLHGVGDFVDSVRTMDSAIHLLKEQG